MTANWRPDLWCGVAFNADPNDPAIVPVWKDLTNQLQAVDDISRGRQYELDTNQAGQPTITFDDPNEYLNPANTSSPYSPNVVPYRALCLLGVWANPEDGNLINSGAWHPNNTDAYDPSFESYTNGAAKPNWLTAVGGVTATITTTNPQQGTKDVTYAVAGTATQQGLSWQIPCVPGRQYTTSAYVRQSSASSQRLTVEGLLGAYDKFTRTAASGWGDAATYSGVLTWQVVPFANAANFAVNGTTATITPSANGSTRRSIVGTSSVDFDIRADVSISALPASGTLSTGLVGRYIASTDHYFTVMEIDTAGAVTLRIRRVVGGGAETTIASLATGLTYAAGSYKTMRFQGAGSSLRVRMWPVNTPEPTTWDIDTTDANLTSAGDTGVYARNDTAVTTQVFSYDNWLAIKTAASSTTTTTGSYVALTVTFTAEQPYHTVTLGTIGTASAGTINVDTLQHQPGASQTSFVTTGSVVYPVWRGYVERWPSTWDHQGFRGICKAVATDFSANAEGVPTHTDLFVATMKLAPDLYYPLWEGEQSAAFAEVSGNNATPLIFFSSKYGIGTYPQSGTPLNLLGDQDGAGVTFTPEGDGSGGTQAATIIGAGPQVVATNPGFTLPAVIGTSWSMTASAWFNSTDTSQIGYLVSAQKPGATGGTAWIPIRLWTDFNVAGTTASVGFNNGSLSVLKTSSPFVTAGPHHVVGITTQDATNTSVTIYVDGVSHGTTTVTTASLGGMLGTNATSILVGGSTLSGFGGILNGITGHIAVWNRALTATEITSLWTAGGLGNGGELSGTRMNRLYTNNYVGATNIATGRAIMGATDLGEGTSLRDQTNRVTYSEDGAYWIAPNGYPTFEGRDDRYRRLTPTYTFGEDTAGGEYPYQDDIEFDLDPTYIANDVKVTRTNGATIRILSTASIKQFFQRAYDRTVDLYYDLEAIDAANWILAQHKDPHHRVARITLNPVTYTSLWPVALSVEVGQRVRVKRRPKSANAQAGLTISIDFFVENVAVPSIDLEQGVWTVDLLLSPANGTGGSLQEPWILDDTTYSVLDSTTIAGY